MNARLAYVLDDEPKIGALVCELLAINGFSAVQFSAPAPFFVAVKAASPEVIVLDLALGESDAVEVIGQLDVLKYRGKVLLISGRDHSLLSEIQRIGEAHGLAMLPFLPKPFRAADLKERLDAAATGADQAELTGTHAAPCRARRVDLAEALREDWLELWYQPKIELTTFSVCGAEALLRAQHPQYGLVLPGDLLPPPGDRLYHPLTWFVLRRALSDWHAFAADGLPLKLSLNVPPSVMQSPEFIQVVREVLPDHPAFPGLILEMTEDDVIRDPERVWELATQLKLYRIGISIDDFGTAHSSLARLRDLSCVELKLDRSFVLDCAADDHKKALCQTVIELAHRFDIPCCAEGVETENDLRTLVALGCDLAQGYLLGKPQPRGDFSRTIGARPQQAAMRPFARDVALAGTA